MEVDRLPSSPTGHSRSQLTEAQVETYPMKSYTQQMGMEGSGHTPLQDSSQSASPGGTWSSPYHNSNSSHAREADRARARQDGHSSGKWNDKHTGTLLDAAGAYLYYVTFSLLLFVLNLNFLVRFHMLGIFL